MRVPFPPPCYNPIPLKGGPRALPARPLTLVRRHQLLRPRPERRFDDIQQGTVAVVGIPYDGASTSRQGVRQGPRSIREASADFIYDLQASQSGALIDVISGRVLNTPSANALLDLGDLQSSPLDSQGVIDACTDAFSRISKSGGFPVALGGDRFITFPLVGGLAEGLGQNVGLIRLSGQLSLANPDSSHGPDWTGCVPPPHP